MNDLTATHNQEDTMLETIDCTATEDEIETRLLDMLAEQDDVEEARTFGDVGLLTMNKGLVVVMADGTEFQLTIVKVA